VRILIIGWGNPLRGDDGVGWRAAELLSGTLAGHDVAVRVSHQLMPELAEEISRSEFVVFIAASAVQRTWAPAAQATVAGLVVQV